jgi:nitrite reductase/ring-hydroxylating ferredoxin subunit
MPEFVTIAQKSDVPEGESKAFTCGKHRIALFNVEGAYHAISDTCPHAGGPLSEGWVDGTEVTCPWHGWTFDVRYCEEDRRDGVCRYRVLVDGEDIKVELPD